MGFHRAVVTGGAGFLGSHVCGELLRGGTEVVCVDDLSTGCRENLGGIAGMPGFALRVADVTEPLPVAGDVDLVLHLASPASPPAYLARPVGTLLTGAQGTLRALQLARDRGARFVLASTSEVYGDPRQHPQREGYWGNVNPVGPRSVYDEAKRYAEALTTAFRTAENVNTGIARIFNSYGPRMRADDGRMVPTFIGQCLRGQPVTVTGTGRQTRSLCYVDDTVAGLLALAASDYPGPVNLGSPREVTVQQVAERIRTLAGSRSEIRYVEAVTDDPQRRCPDTRLAASRLGWQPEVGMDDGLRRTIAWFRQP